MATLTLQYLKTKRGVAYRQKNAKQLVWIRTNHGYWGEGNKGYYTSPVDAAIYKLSEAYDMISGLGPEKSAMLRPVDITLIDKELHESLKRALSLMNKKEDITDYQTMHSCN